MPPTEAKLTIEIDRLMVDHFLSWAGPCGRSIDRLARRTVIEQKAAAPKKTGALAASIRWTRGISSKGLTFTSGSSLKYAGWMEHGTKAHMIYPKSRSGILAFHWPKAGRMVYLRSVHHPGTKPLRYLEKGYRRALAAWQVTG